MHLSNYLKRLGDKRLDFLEKLKLTVQKKINLPALVPTFYICPYALPDPVVAQYNYDIDHIPDKTLQYDVNYAFLNVDDNQEAGTYGNKTSTVFIGHVLDLSITQQSVQAFQSLGRRVYYSLIDGPNIFWDKVNIPVFVSNTQGQLDPDGKFIANDIVTKLGKPTGFMWDIETEDSAAAAMTKVMKASFLQGILIDPENYTFIYTTYANRNIDNIILNSTIDPNGDEVDQALCKLGFTRFSDLITKRGNLSFLETMNYGGTAQERFLEAEAYVQQLAQEGDDINEIRKHISIGVAAGLTEPDQALDIAVACNSERSGGYGRFMVWSGNCDAGVNLFDAMYKVWQNPKLAQKDSSLDRSKLPPKIVAAPVPGNRAWYERALAGKYKINHLESDDSKLTAPTGGIFNPGIKTDVSSEGRPACIVM